MRHYLVWNGEVRNRVGYIYVLKITDGPSKIGKTSDIEKRSSVLAVVVPYECNFVVVRKVFDMTAFESALHKHFEAQWLKGEWYNLSSSDIDFIKDCDMVDQETRDVLTTPLVPKPITPLPFPKYIQLSIEDAPAQNAKDSFKRSLGI